MRWELAPHVAQNSFDYFEKTSIASTGFREYDVRWILGQDINPNGFILLGKAYGAFILEELRENRVVVGHDFRSYSQNLSHSFMLGLLSTGVDVIDIGLALSPLLYFAQHLHKTKAGAMITASHNENGWCGLKLANGLSSTLGPPGIKKLKDLVMQGRFPSGRGSYESSENVFDSYLQDIVEGGTLARPLKVVFAAGNGTAGRFGPDLLRKLGCSVIELDCDADWDFPHHNPNPENMEFLASISKKTVSEGAALGIGVDGDGDRIGVVDDKGCVVFADRLGLLIARHICRQHPGRAVVVDVKSTSLFFDDPVLQEAQTDVVMWKTGHSYIKAKAAELKAVAAFEKSGHWFFGSPLGRGYDDALISSAVLVRLLDEVGKPLSSLLDELPRTWQSPTFAVECPDTEKYSTVEGLSKGLANDSEAGVRIAAGKIEQLITINGIRFVLDSGSWGLIRASSNKPELVVVAESRHSKEELEGILDFLAEKVRAIGLSPSFRLDKL